MYKSSNFIETACKELDFIHGDLVDINNEVLQNEFKDRGDWINLCKYISKDNQFKVDKIFYVKDEPVIVFADVKKDSVNFYEIYNTVWCMARPRILFLNTNSGLFLFDLSKKPVKSDVELIDRALVVVKEITNIKTALNEYDRQQVESGRVFESSKFSEIDYRADFSLIKDLKIVRDKLFESGLSGEKLPFAHSLIGRSIFIRYLEDRKILTREYFYEIAQKNQEWKKILDKEPDLNLVDETIGSILYPKVLSDKKFTYALFKKIAIDFNGDVFPTNDSEEKNVSKENLLFLQNFLYAKNSQQSALFFWAYKFDIIPIELISNIYEEFYHYKNKETGVTINQSDNDSNGTHYTPAPLVEFVLSKTLSIENLLKKPRVIDPACGSGIFLVESFKKIVRFELFLKKKNKLTYKELLVILKNQIAGIELNEEAIKITSFSLYLSFLHYQSPPDILKLIAKGIKLPHLVYTSSKISGEEYLDILIHSNAFEIDKLDDKNIINRFSSNCADIVVGNPPWGSPAKDDIEGRNALNAAVQWCEKKGKPISDLERSQIFIWLSEDLLKKNGFSGLLVSSGILFKQSDKSNIFKQAWINSVQLKEIINFVHVRDVFFTGAISPFLCVIFKKDTPKQGDFIEYLTAKRTKMVENTKSIFLDKTDFKFFLYSETYVNDIWKIFYFGNHLDLRLINRLRQFDSLNKFEFTLENSQPRRQGFIEGNKKLNSDWLKDYKELPANCFKDRYSKISFNKVLVDVPKKVKERGIPKIYQGLRLLIGNISAKTTPKGQLVVRLESRKFSFRNTINCIILKDEYKQDYKVFLGILWSSLARYYFFLTASKWGSWHDQVYLNEILNLPISLPNNQKLKLKIIQIVESLQTEQFDNEGQLASLFDSEKTFNVTKKELESQLDVLIFKLYNLSDSEIDLILDRCNFDIDFFYNSSNSIAVKKLQNFNRLQGRLSDLNRINKSKNALDDYLKTFLGLWTLELEENFEFEYKIILPNHSPLITLVFSMVKKAAINAFPDFDNAVEWKNVLAKLNKEISSKYSEKIYLEGMVRITTDNQIIIIKRNEARLWTNSSAREDVEATILQAILIQETNA